MDDRRAHGDEPGLCRHFGRCGGCQTQDRPYADQLAGKARWVAECLGPYAAGAAIAPVAPMPVGAGGRPWGFRHKAAFVFGRDAAGGLTIGHYAAGSRIVVPVRECPVHAARANRIAFALHRHLAAARVPAAGPDLDGLLRHVIVRTTHDEREAVAMLVVTRNDRSLRRPVRAFLAGPERPTGFFVNVHDRPGPFMVGRETIRIDGRSHVREEWPGAAFLVSPTAFFQTNPEGARLLVDEVVRAAGPPGTLLDLYAGSGLFALPLARRGWRVTAVEENRQAMRDAEANLRLNGLPPGRVRLVVARVEAALADLRPPVDLVVLDPPRQGASPPVIDAVFGRLAPPRAIYVSCNPASLGAELPAIAGHGYRVTRVLPVDMFPHTDHVELVATIERSGGRRGGREARRR